MKRNGYVQSMSLYADIQMYNLSSHLGPPIRRGVPTQMFPTFLNVPSKVPYDILTYNTLQNYPSVEGAYPLESNILFENVLKINYQTYKN